MEVHQYNTSCVKGDPRKKTAFLQMISIVGELSGL